MDPLWKSEIRLQLQLVVHPHTPDNAVQLLKVSIDSASADLGKLGRAGVCSLVGGERWTFSSMLASQPSMFMVSRLDDENRTRAKLGPVVSDVSSAERFLNPARFLAVLLSTI